MQALPLKVQILATNNETGGKVVLESHFPEGFKYLVGQLTSWRDYQSSQAIQSSPLKTKQLLQHWDDKSQSFATASFCSAENIQAA